MTEEKPRIIVGVPGSWSSRSEIVTSIAARSGGYLFAGLVLMEVATRDAFTLEVYDHDERLRNAFEVAGGGRFSEAELDAIDQHTYTLYVIGEGGSPEAARKVMRADPGRGPGCEGGVGGLGPPARSLGRVGSE